MLAAQRDTICIPVICTLLAFTSITAWCQDVGLTLRAALQQATSRSTALQAGQAAERAGAHAAIRAGQLPDPMLHVGVDNLPLSGPAGFSLARDSMTMRHVGIEQEWLSADKRARRSALAHRELAQERAATLVRLADVRRQTALAWLDATFVARALELAQALVKQMDQELAAVRAAYRGMRASAAEVTRAQAGRARGGFLAASGEQPIGTYH